MRCMFSNCGSLESVKLFRTHNVADMMFAFGDCTSLKTIYVSDTSNVTNMHNMFMNCSSLKDINPYNFKLFDFKTLDNAYLKLHYPELYI